jgi:hypothetical protein
MKRNFHLKYINNPDYYNTAAEKEAENIEYLIIAKSQSHCDDSVNWDYIIENAQYKLTQALNKG